MISRSVVVASVLLVILMALSLLHLYWALGGEWGIQVAIPVVDGRPAFEPGFWNTIAISTLLALAGVLDNGHLGRTQSS